MTDDMKSRTAAAAPAMAAGTTAANGPVRDGLTPEQKVALDDAKIPMNPHVKYHCGFGDRMIDFVIWLILAIIVALVIYPIWFIIIASFSNQNAVASGQVILWPKGFSFTGYQRVFADARIWLGYRNTLIYSIDGTLLNMIVTIPAAFALSRREFKPRRVILFLFTVTMFFSGGLIPQYLLYKSLGPLDSMWVYILPGAVSVWNVIISRSFFESSIPEDLHDAAQIDGADYFTFFYRIVLPVSGAILAVISLYYFVGHWNDFFTGLVFIRSDNKLPLQNVLRSILLANQTGISGHSASGRSALEMQQYANQIKYGVIIVSTVPLLIIYPFIQKYFTKGVMIGALKG